MTGATGGEQVFESLVHLYSAEPLENEIGWDDMKQGHEEQGCIRGKKAMRHNIYIYILLHMNLTSPCSSISDHSHLSVSVRSLRWEACESPRLCLPEHQNLCGIGFVHLSAIQQAIQKLDQSNDFLKIFLKAYGHRLSDSVTALTV